MFARFFVLTLKVEKNVFFHLKITIKGEVMENLIFAYIDPFTGSLLLQVVTGGVVGVLLFFKQIKMKIVKAWQKSPRNSIEGTEIDE